MAAPPWYRWFPSDFAQDTKHLSMLERGAYRDLLDYYYQSGGKLRSDLLGLYRICGAVDAAEQAAVRKVMDEYFQDGEIGYLRNSRADVELAEQVKYLKTQADKGRKGAEKRYGRCYSTAIAAAMPVLSHKDSHSHTHTHKQNTNPIVRSLRFAEFWEKYPGPRKVARSKCEQVWGAKDLDPLADQILSHIALMAVSEQWVSGYAPAPLTYLNQRRWEDGTPQPPERPRRLAI